MYDQALDAEIARVNEHSHNLLNAYLGWGQKIISGEVENTLYSDLLDFVNFRLETVDTCLLLIEKEKIADALGLCRSILENYLLLVLMCRGHKFYLLQNLGDKTKAEFNDYFLSKQQELEKQQKEGNTSWLGVAKYPPARQHLIYTFEGLRDEVEPDLRIPMHFFEFQEFHPETMRLRDEDYFDYYPPRPDVTEAQNEHRQEAALKHRLYLSYGALLKCLELNNIADKAVQTRIEAHYTFLGKYLHPTHDAARDLRQRNNWHRRQTVLGFDHPYEKTAVLLASLYVCFLLTGILEEIAGLLEKAPPKYISDAGAIELRSLTEQTWQSFNYFWFIFNEAPLYDKYIYCIHCVSDEELATLKHYSNIASNKIPFDMHIYGHLKAALGRWSNSRCGEYVSPHIRS